MVPFEAKKMQEYILLLQKHFELLSHPTSRKSMGEVVMLLKKEYASYSNTDQYKVILMRLMIFVSSIEKAIHKLSSVKATEADVEKVVLSPDMSVSAEHIYIAQQLVKEAGLTFSYEFKSDEGEQFAAFIVSKVSKKAFICEGCKKEEVHACCVDYVDLSQPGSACDCMECIKVRIFRYLQSFQNPSFDPLALLIEQRLGTLEALT